MVVATALPRRGARRRRGRRCGAVRPLARDARPYVERECIGGSGGGGQLARPGCGQRGDAAPDSCRLDDRHARPARSGGGSGVGGGGGGRFAVGRSGGPVRITAVAAPGVAEELEHRRAVTCAVLCWAGLDSPELGWEQQMCVSLPGIRKKERKKERKARKDGRAKEQRKKE